LIVDGYNGWVIGDRHGNATRETLAWQAFGLLERDLREEFYDRDPDGVPRRWVDGVRRSLAALAWQVSSGPMVRAYGRLYRDAARATTDLRMPSREREGHFHKYV
jgi:starch phosphorylase